MNVRETFELRAGPDVKYVADRKVTQRTLEIRYVIPDFDTERTFTILIQLRNGLTTTLHRAVCMAAQNAQQDAYRRTGKRDRDMAMMLQGKVIR